MIFTERNVAMKALATYTILSILIGFIPALPKLAEASTSITIFEDDFETAGTPFASWTTTSGNWTVTGSDAHSGNKKAKVTGNSATTDVVEIATSTSGYGSIDLSFWYHYTNLVSGDTVTAEWFDGTNWNTLATFGEGTVSDWTEWTGTIPVGADNNADFALRFSAEIASGNVTFYLDDVNISGEEIATTPTSPSCSSTDSVAQTTFDTFSLGNVNGQNDWKSTGSYDQEIVENTYGYDSFGCQSLRVSNAVTTGSFGDQTFAAPLTDSVGEADATAGSFSEGTRYNHYEVQFDIASAKPNSEQSGLALSVSPDRGDGSRMSYLSFADVTGGIGVTFYDTQGTTDPANFVPTDLGTYDRTVPHTVKFVMDMEDGADNDVVKIYIDGTLIHTGTSWENYYRFDGEASAEQSPRLMKTLLIRSAGPAKPSNDGYGFLFDNMSLEASNVDNNIYSSETTIVKGDTTTSANQPEVGWMFNRDPENQAPFEFNTDMPDIGSGSLFVKPITNTVNTTDGNKDKFIGELYLYEDIANVDSISYDFKLGAGSETAEEHFYANVYVTLPSPNAWYDCKYNVIPTTGSTTDFTTVTFDTSSDYDVTSKVPGSYICPSSPSDLPAGSTLNFFALNVGDTSANDTGVSGYLDNVATVIKNGYNVHTTTYDFEPLDTTKPVIEVVNPISGFITNSDFDITVHATDNEELSKVVVNLKDGTNTGHIGTCLNQSLSGVNEATSSCTVDISELPNGDGDYYFRTNAKDSDQNLSNTISQKFTVDTTGPTITVKAESAGNGTDYTNISFKLFDAHKVDYLTLNGVTKNLTDNNWSDLNGVKPNKFGAVEGLNTLVVYDVAGNSTTFEFTLVVDNTGPTITVKDNMSEQLSNSQCYFEASFKLFDEFKVDKLTLNGQEKDLTNNKWSDLNYVSPGAFGAVLGSNSLVVYDVAGNSTTYNFCLAYDTEKPKVNIDTPDDGEVLTTGLINATGTASDLDSDIEEVKYTVTKIDGLGGSYVANVDSGVTNGTTNWSFDVNIDTPGFYRFKVQAFDEYGNWKYQYHDIEVKELISCTMVSDEGTVVLENNDYAVDTWTHNNWTAYIPGAEWIWETFYVEDPEVSTTRTFEESFEVSDISDATLYLASDNKFKLYVNDVLVDESNYSNNFQSYSQKEYTDIANYLVEGENTLKIEVTNIGTENSIAKTNPAGVLYKLVVNTAGGSCVVTTQPEEEFFTLDGYKWNDADADGIWDENEEIISDWIVYATNGQETVSTTTDSNGHYSFEVKEGSWEVYEATSTSWTQTGTVLVVDDETDGYVDGNSCIFDIDTKESESPFSTLQCNFGNHEELVLTTLTSGGGGGTSSYAGTGYAARNGGSSEPEGQVLGASTDQCTQYLADYISPGAENNQAEVTKLQQFLINLEGFKDLTVTGVYDKATQQALGEFQDKYASYILTPWGITSHTLNVYYTTQKTINEIYCDWEKEFPLNDKQQMEIEWFRKLDRSGSSNGDNNNSDLSGKPAILGLNQPSGNEDDNQPADNDENSDNSDQTASVINSTNDGGLFNKFVGFFKNMF